MRSNRWIIAVMSAGVICGCSASSSSSQPAPAPSTAGSPASAAPTPTSPPSPARSLPALPKGYVSLNQPHIRIGVPSSWIRVQVKASAASIRKLESKHPSAKGRLVSDNSAQPAAGRMFAVDPATTAQILVLVLPTPGVKVTRKGLIHIYNTSIKPVFAQDHIQIVSHRVTKLGGRDNIRIKANYVRNGLAVREIVDVAVGDSKIYDLTFSGSLRAIAKVEATVAIT
jgi:hypothetical protein